MDGKYWLLFSGFLSLAVGAFHGQLAKKEPTDSYDKPLYLIRMWSCYTFGVGALLVFLFI